MKDVNNENALAFNKISLGEKNYKHFIGYLYDDYKFKPLHIMVLKRVRMEKIMIGKLNGCILRLKLMTYWKNITLF